MNFNQPLEFEPVLMERVWGGHLLRELFHKAAPVDRPIGESWELVDRAEAQSVVRAGPGKYLTLNELWSRHRSAVFGGHPSEAERFPLLIKILDAREKLSLQVHPPPEAAAALRGEPKTEIWYVARAEPGSELYAGLVPGVRHEDFETALRDGSVEKLLHRIPVRAGDALFVPSGRLHAIGAGNLIFEIQQNSDTTYRVFDWNRQGLDGKPRQLHVEESMRCIDFEDVTPSLLQPVGDLLVECPFFRVEHLQLEHEQDALGPDQDYAIFGVLEGRVGCGNNLWKPGDFALVPSSMRSPRLTPVHGAAGLLRITVSAR